MRAPVKISGGTLFTVGIGLVALAVFFSRQSWAGAAILVGLIFLVAAVVMRPRDRRARLVAQYAAFGHDWGDGIGPGPDETGSVVSIEQLTRSLHREYAGRSDFEVRTKRAADGAALGSRGYLPVSETFVEGSWRGSQWVLAFLLLAIAIIPGAAALIYMASNKPGGTATVTYERAGTEPAPIGAATMTAASGTG
jgi:hypothetical protein